MRIPVLIILVACSFAALGQSLALTFDDGLNPADDQRAQAWNDQLLAGLKAASISSMIFPALAKVGDEDGRLLVQQWSNAGHLVGNHTSKHRNLASGSLSLDEFINDIVEADQAFGDLPNWRPMLRFPYLKEGDTVAKRDGVRAWMRTHGYRSAPVSIDTSDWYFNRVWLELVAHGQDEKLARLQQAYVDHLLDRASYYDALANATLQRSPPHVMLLHVNAINAASITMVSEAFRSRGWTFTTPTLAFADPLYSMSPVTLPAGESVIWALARKDGHTGLRYPAEDSVYEEPLLRAQQLLP